MTPREDSSILHRDGDEKTATITPMTTTGNEHPLVTESPLAGGAMRQHHFGDTAEESRYGATSDLPEAHDAPRSSPASHHEDGGDLRAVKADLESLARNLKSLVSQASSMFASDAARSGSQMSSQVSGTMTQVSDRISSAAGELAERGAEIGASASQQIKTITGEVETMARNNPLGAIATALCVGFLVGTMRRGR